MVEFTNRLTGGKMWVADDRIEEYKAAGHKPAVPVAKKPADTPEAKPKKRASKDGNGK